MAFSLDSKVKDILKNPAAAAVLDKYSPDASKNPQMKLVGGLTLRKLASFPQSAFLKPHLEELEKEPFDSVLDCGCGTGPVIELLHEKYPDKHYTGLDLTPEMIRVAQAKNLSNTNFVVGDCENIPFPEDTFDAIISSNSFHHYPNPQDFFNNAYRVLKKNGRLILRDYTTKSKVLLWLCNHIEMPLAHLCGHGDVRLYSGAEFKKFAETAGFEVISFEAQAKMRAHLVARKN